jgi:hypothetical protein
MKLVASNPVAMALLLLASPCAVAADEVSDREIRLRRSIHHLGGDLAHDEFSEVFLLDARPGLLTLESSEEDDDDKKEIERFLEIRSSMSMSLALPSARIAPGKDGSKDGKKSKSNKEAAKRVKTKDAKSKDGKSEKDSKKLRKNDKSKDAKMAKETKGKEGIKKTKKGGEETKTTDKIVVAKKNKGHRALGVGFSEPTGKSKDGKSKSDKAKVDKSKSEKSKSDESKADKSKSGKPESDKSKADKSKFGKANSEKSKSDKKEKSKDTKTKDKLVEAKENKGHRALGVGLLEPTGKSKDGKSKSGKSGKDKLEKSKSEKKEKKQVRKDHNKISLPLSKSEKQREKPNVKVTSAPQNISEAGHKAKSDKAKSASKGKAGSRKYMVRRRAQALEPVVWNSDRRELGAGCMIGTSEVGRTSSNTVSKVGVGKADGKSGKYDGSKSDGKSGSGKFGGKSGSKSGGKSGKYGSKVGRHDRGHRRTEMGLYACHMSGSWTCCKEYGDMGDDPVCCKDHYTNEANEDVVLLPEASSSTENGKGSSDDNDKGSSTDNGKVDRSHSNDIPALNNQGGGGGDPSVVRPQGLSTMTYRARSISND